MRDKDRNVVKSVKLNRLQLLDIVKTNVEKHVAEYKEAVEDYKKAVLKIATDNLEFAKATDFSKFKSFPNKPTSYENDYKRAIRMLELGVEDVIDVEEDVFNQLVLDEWHWKNSFSASNIMYKSLF